MSSPDISGTVQSVATGPQSAASDGLTVTQPALPDIIASDRYLAARSARAQVKRGLMFTKIIAAGPVSDSQGTGFGVTNFAAPGVNGLT